jgi:streptogramin lyase
MKANVVSTLFLVVAVIPALAAEPPVMFENLGRPLKPLPVSIEVVTPTPKGSGHIAWSAIRTADRKGLMGTDVSRGKSTWVDLSKWDYGRIFLTRAPNGHLYLYTGSPGRFFKLDTSTLRLMDLGAPASKASYTMGAALAPDGRFYSCSYPKTSLVCVDTNTDQVFTFGRLSRDPRNKYATGIAVSDDNIVYVATGLHHAELWSYDPATESKTQILPDEVCQADDRVKVTLGEDGHVYATAAGATFRCRGDAVQPIERTPARRAFPERLQAGEWLASSVTSEGKLLLRHAETGLKKEIETDFDGVAVRLYGVFCDHDRKIYGGGFEPANVFRYDPATGAMEDLGRLTAGRIQVYDILSHARGLFLSSYTGAHLDYWNPDTGKKHHIATLLHDYEQERGLELRVGPDGMIYLASRPSKGKLGGALTRIDPKTFAWKCWRHVIPNHSVHSITPIPETKELLCTTSVYGGSGSVPVEKEGFVFLWDCEGEEVVWKAVPIPGDRSYGEMVRCRDGLAFVHAHDEFLLLDPLQHKVVHRGGMPVEHVRPHGIADRPAGDGLIYGLGDDALFVFDPATRKARVVARHSSIASARGLHVSACGDLFYINGASLWRARFKADEN